MERHDPLPSWRPGGTRDALEAFLAAAEEVPVADRVAYFDNDGTLWCERPSYVQLLPEPTLKGLSWPSNSTLCSAKR